MRQIKAVHMVDGFFKDKQGKWAIVQLPNVLLLIWIILLVANFFMHDRHARLLQGAVLFAWAYAELTEGTSYFRKSFGGIILIVTVLGFFLR